MKKLLLLFVMIMMAMTVMAQTTEKITYQAVVRDRTNRLVVYTPVRVDVTITYSSGSYFESLRDTTNANGLMYVLIGGNPGFENINWQRAVIKTVITIEGGETVSDEVVVTAVPIALQANYAMNVSPTAPTIVAVYNQLQADSLALANRIAAERAHLDDTLSHYLMQEVQVLSISNDTIYLTGGSFVKLPAGFSGNYNDLTNLPDLNQYATNVHLNDTLSHYLMQEVQVLSVSNDTLYLTGGSWVKLPQGFSGNYNDLTNLPDLNQYATNVHLNDTLSHYLMQEVQVLSVSNDTLYLTGGSWVKLPQGFSGDYNDLTNLPDLNQYATNVHLNDTLKNYLTINGLCDSIKNCEAITNLQTADSLLGVRITRDSIVLSGKIYSDSVYLKGLIDSIKVNVTNNTTNITNNTTNISNITNNVTSLQVADSVLSDRFTRDSIALSNRLDTMFAHICDSIAQCDVITNLQAADSLLGNRITRDSILFYKTDSILANRITRDSILSYKADSILAVRITRDSIFFYKADSILSMRITADSINLVNNYYDKIKINDTVAYILSQITTASGNLNDNYYTKVEINDTLSHYTTSDRIDSLLGDYVKKDTLENYLTIAGLCDSIKNCEVITNLQTADSLLGVRITRDSILSYKADSILAAHILIDSVVSYKTDSILSVRISTDSANLADNYYTKVEINDTLSHYTTSDNIDSLLGDFVKKDTLENYLTIAGLCDSIKNCEVITNLQTADSLLGIRITRDSILSYKADSILADRITRDSILSHLVDSVLSAHIINDSILFYKTDSVLLVHILNDSILSYHADSIILARILNDSILSHKADSILAAHILIDSVVSYRADSILSVRITADSANLANNYYTKVEINDTLSHYTTSDNIDSLLGDFVKKDTLENYLTIAGLCDSIKNCEVITNLQTADSLLGVRITRDSILSYKTDSILVDRITRDSILSYKADSILANRITRDSVLFYKADSVLAGRITRDSILSYKADSILVDRITRDSILSYKADSVLSTRITADSLNLVNNYYNKIKINDTVAYILSQIAGATGNLNDNYYTKLEINDTLSHYTTSDHVDSLLGDYVKKDTLKNYLTISGLCDSIKNCDVITNLQAADSLLGVRITRDSILSYKTDSILANRISRDSILSYKADSILANRITRDSILFYNADSVLSARITADSINLVNNYYNKIKINDTVAYILSQIAGATGNLNDNYYTKSEINDTLSHYTTSDHVDSLLGDYVKKDTLKNYLTIAGLCDSIKNCDVIANMATGITTNTTNISNNTTNITNNTTNITNLQIADSVLNARFTKDSTILANRMDTLLKHVCDSVKPCVTEWMNDTLKAYTTSNKIDTLIQKYGYVTTAHLNDTLSRYTTTNKIDTLIQKYGYATTAHLNDTLGHYTTSNQVDTLLTAYEKKADLCNDVMVCIGDTLSKYTTSNKIDTLLGAYATNAHLNDTLKVYTTTNKIDTLIQKYGYATTAHLNDTLSRYTTTNKIDTLIQKYGYTTTAHLNDTLRRYTTTNQIDTLIKKYGYLTSDSAVIVRMRDSIQKVNNRLTYDSTALAHRMDTLLKHVCDSVKPCVTGWMNDTLKAYTTSNKIDTLLGAYATNAHLNDTLKVYTTTNKIDTLIQKYGYTTAAHLNDTLGHYTTSNQVDTLLTAYEKKADLCKDVMGCIGDTLSKYTTTNQIDTLIKKYGYLTSDSAVIVRMRDSIQKVNNRLTYDSTALAHRMDTLLKHVCDSVKPCVTGWMNDTLKAYTTTNKIDTLIQKYGYTTIAHLNDTLRRYTTTNQIDTLIKKYGYLTSDSTVIVTMRDSIQKVNNRLTYDSTKLADRIHTDSIALVNRIVTDSTVLAHRMDTLLKHVCDSVKPCVTGWMNDTLKAYTTTNKIDTLLGAYATNAHLNDTLSWYTTTNKIDTLIQKYGYATTAHLNDTLSHYTTSDHVDTLLNAYEKKADLCKDVMGCIGDTLSKYTTTNNIDTLIQKYGYTTIAHLNDTLRRYTTTNQIDTLIRKYGYLTSDSTVIVTMRDSIQKVNNRLTYDSTKLADRIHTDSIALVNRIVTDSTALAHRMDTLLKHVCDSVKPCVTGWMNDTLKAYTTSNKIDTLLGAYVTNAHLNDTLSRYTTTNKIDTLIQKYGYTTTAHLNDTLKKYTTSNQVDTLLNAYEKRADLCKDVMGCIGDTLSKYTTTNQIDTLIKKYGYLTSDSAVIVRMRDSIQKVNNRLTYDSTKLADRIHTDSITLVNRIVTDSTALAHRMDTLLKHVCDSVQPCVTAWIKDSLKVVKGKMHNDSLALAQRICKDSVAVMDTLHKYYATKDTLKNFVKKDALCTEVMACDGIKTMRDSIQKVNNRLTNDSTKLADRIHTDSIALVNRIVTDSTALAHRMDTLLKHVCDSVKPCVTGWIKDSTRMVFDSLHRYYTSLSTLADSMHRVDVRIKHDSLEVVELYKQAQTALQTLALKEMADSLTLATRMDTVYKHLCDSVMNCDGIKTMQTNITDVTNNLDSSKTNIRSEISSLNTKLQSNIDSTSQHVRGALKDTAAAIRNSIGKGTLTIQYGTDDPVTFNANQKTDTSIIIPAPTTPNDATLTIQKNGTTVGTFTANQAADNTINITVPTCDSLAECDLIKSILARLDKLERQNDSLAKEIEKLKPTLTVAASHENVTVCKGSLQPVTYTATFHNCSSSDYTLAWKVNGTDSSNVTGPTLVFNAETEGSYTVVCIATRSDSTFVTDTVTTAVSVDADVPSFTVAIEGLTVTLSNVMNTATIQWDTDSLPESFTSASHTYSVADTITITATSERGCTFTKDTVLQPIAPVVTTDSVPAIAATTAIAYGTVTSDGGNPNTKRGMLYSTSNSELKFGANGVDSVMKGTGKGNYACTLERLVPCTKYYVRAFAYNEVDTVYGIVKEFTTPSFTCGSTLYDIDGNDYATLLLGSQCWMKQNLRTTRYADGTEIPYSTSTVYSHTSPYRYAPDSWSSEDLVAYGYLYNWVAAMHGSSSSAANPSGVRGACPAGWHLPSDAEWTQLTDFVASDINNVCNDNPAYFIKAMASLEGWGTCVGSGCVLCSDTSKNNTTGFSVLPSGVWNTNNGAFDTGLGYQTGVSDFYSSTGYEDNKVWIRLFDYYEDVRRTAYASGNGYSIRCVLDCATGHTYLPTVSGVSLIHTGDTTVSMAASVASDGGAEVSERGVCWSTTQHFTPTSTTNHTEAAEGGVGDFAVIGKLAPGKTYYVRAYATNSKGTAYGAEVTFVMPNFPTVTTAEVTEISANTATTGGEVTADGGKSVTARGVCWSTSANPTIENDTTLNLNLNGSNVGSFVSNLTGLTPSETYHVRAYATNSVGTAYGEDVSFTTTSLVPPTVTTGAVNLNVNTANVITVTATCEGDVTDEGTDAVTARGVCWSISQNPTIDDSLTTDDGSGTGSFTCNITGFNASTTYYVRAYATNSAGTAYGNQVVFTPKVDAKSCAAAPTVTDHEGNEYATVQIGNYCWMRENLRTTTSPKTGTYLVNTEHKTSNVSSYKGSKVAHWPYNNSTTYAPKGYGLQYNWCAAMDTANPNNYVEVPTQSSGGNNTSFKFSHSEPHRGICPAGWHVPSFQEWGNLTSAVSEAGKLAGGNDWDSSSNATAPGNYDYADRNVSGFTALPAGKFNNSNSDRASTYAYFWCSMQMADTNDARCMILYKNDNTTYNNYKDGISQGMSVRCVRNEGHAALIFVTTGAASNIAQTSATLNGSISNASNITITQRGFELKETVGGSYTPVTPDVDDPLSCNLTGLTPNTAYTFRAFATTSEGTIYGYEKSFTTLGDPTGITVTTASATEIDYTSATLNGSIVNPNPDNYSISEQGFEYKVGSDGSYTPIILNVEDPLSYNLTGLNTNTSYTFRAFVTTAYSTIYGDEVNFTTLKRYCPNLTPGSNETAYLNGIDSIMDVDSNRYAVVQIGNQCWMAENLRTKRYSDSTAIPLNNTQYPFTISRYYPYGNEGNVSNYGCLYNWEAIKRGFTPSNYGDNSIGGQGVCPMGWHVPSADEFQILSEYVSGQNEYLCGGNIGKALASTSGWESVNDNTCKIGYEQGNNNATGFNAVPAGQLIIFNQQSYDFYYFGQWSCFWLASVYYNIYPMYFTLDYNRTDAPIGAFTKYVTDNRGYGLSVRCVRDAQSSTPSSPVSYTLSIDYEDTEYSVCEGGSVSVTYTATVTADGNPVSGGYNYEWGVPSGMGHTENGNTCTVTYTAANTYTVSCTATPTGTGETLSETTQTTVSQNLNCGGGSPTGRLILLDTIQHNFVAQDGDILTNTLGSSVKISIAADATVTLQNAIINGTNCNSCEWAGISCEEGDATIILEGTNTLKGFNDNPGVYVAANKTLTIQGAGTLNASSHGAGAGIGGSGWGGSCGNIIISGGTINATGGGDDFGGAAGIGSGSFGSCGSITINNGAVISNGGFGSAGIGSGQESSCGVITIGGGSVEATGGYGAAGVGSGLCEASSSNACDNIFISGGEVTATGGQMAAGIGSGLGYAGNSTCGNISISGGEITATGGQMAAGIGSGLACGDNTPESICGAINITSGSVVAIGGSDGNFNVVFQTGDYPCVGGAGIGTGSSQDTHGFSSCGAITITSGVTHVTATKGSVNVENSIGKNHSENPGTCGTVTIVDDSSKVTQN